MLPHLFCSIMTHMRELFELRRLHMLSMNDYRIMWRDGSLLKLLGMHYNYTLSHLEVIYCGDDINEVLQYAALYGLEVICTDMLNAGATNRDKALANAGLSKNIGLVCVLITEFGLTNVVSCLRNAAKRGNLHMVAAICNCIVLKPTDLNEIIISAAEADQFDIVIFLGDEIDDEVRGYIMYNAVKHNRFDMFRRFFVDDESAIDESFELAEKLKREKFTSHITAIRSQ